MILTRLFALILRFSEFVCAAVVLGLDAYFIHLHRNHQGGPIGREIYIIILATISTLLALVWMIPTTHAMLHVPADLLLSVGWFASFGLLVNYLHNTNCGGYFTWGGIGHNNTCSRWQAAEAFSFIAACCWAVSAVLGLWLHRSVNRRANRHAV